LPIYSSFTPLPAVFLPHSTTPPTNILEFFINLTPCIPLSLERKGGRKRRGACAPLELSLLYLPFLKGWNERELTVSFRVMPYGVFNRDEASL
jgi:hypothetical protein